jgi:hypothetical protein
MRSEDYSLREESFLGPIGRAQKARAALVEGGLEPGYQQRTHLDLVKRFSLVSPDSIDRCVHLFGKKRKPPEEQEELEHILGQLSYRSHSWKRLDYDVLRAEGVIRDFRGSIGYLAELALRTPEHIVFCVDPGILDRSEDYKKHIRDAYKLRLDSKEVIAAFAQRRGLELSSSFHERGYLKKSDKKILEQGGFTFSEALRGAVDFLQNHPSKRACVLTFKNPTTGNETRLFPYSVFVEAPEHFLYFRDYADFGLIKDYALKEFSVPKRYPETEEGLTDLVEIQYLPDFEKKFGLDWVHTQVFCDCEHARNQRNLYLVRGTKRRIPNVVDEHVCSAMLFYLQEKGLSLSVPNSFVKFMQPAPLRAVDFLRYNVYGAYEESSEEISIEGREDLLNNALPELFRIVGFGGLFRSFGEEIEEYVLRPMHHSSSSL